MKGLLVALVFWICVVPSLIVSFLILSFLAAVLAPLYLALAWFALSFAAFALLSGPFHVLPADRFQSERLSARYQQSNSFQEIEHENHFAGKSRA